MSSLHAFLCIVACLPSFVTGVVIGGFVIPHGDFVYDPSLVHNTNGSLELHESAIYVGQLIQAMKPDVIVLSTPHGMALSRAFALYANSHASGFALLGQDLHNTSFPSYHVPLDNITLYNDTDGLRKALNDDDDDDVEGLMLWGDSEDAGLRWGEVIPLTFLTPYIQQSHVSISILSHPTRRLTDAALMVPELLTLGSHLYDYWESQSTRVAIVISSDLAHTHDESGPYGYSKDAQPFDDAIGKWGATLDETSLLTTARSYVTDALSCGYTGLVTLHGMLSRGNLSQWKPTMYANAHPTYYGMMVASFLRTD